MTPFPFLRPGGDGLHTVHTKREIKLPLQYQIYNASNELEIKRNWEKAWKNVGIMPTLLGVPFDTGGGIHRGANWGPLELRKMLRSLLKNYADAGDIWVVPQLTTDKILNDETILKVQQALYGSGHEHERHWPVSPLSMLDHFASFYFSHYKAPLLTLGGDHSISAPLISNFIKKHPHAAIIHFDAHTDLMTSRLGIDHCFATWAAQVSTQLNDHNRFIQLGIRSSGKNKEFWEHHFPVTQYWCPDLISTPPQEVARKLINQFTQQNVDALYLSFDVDCLDCLDLPFTGTAEANGLSIKWCEAFLTEFTKSSIPILAADIVELAPYVNMTDHTFDSSKILEDFSVIPKIISKLLLQSGEAV